MAKKQSPKKLTSNTRAAIKQTKKSAKNVVRNVKEVAKQFRAIKKTVSKKVATKKVAIKKARPKYHPLKGQGVFSLRDAPYAAGRTALAKLASIERNAEKFDALKDPKQMWAMSLYGYRTWKVFGSASLLRDYMLRYDAVRDHGSDTDEDGQELIDSIEILTWNGTGKQNQTEKRQEHGERKERNRGLKAKLDQMLGSRDYETKKRKTVHDHLETLLAMHTQQQDEMARMRQLIADLQNGPKPSKKSTTKKTAKKKAVTVNKASNHKAASAHKMRSEAAKRAAVTRKANQERARKEAAKLHKKRSKAAKQAAVTRKANQEARAKAAAKAARKGKRKANQEARAKAAAKAARKGKRK